MKSQITKNNHEKSGGLKKKEQITSKLFQKQFLSTVSAFLELNSCANGCRNWKSGQILHVVTSLLYFSPDTKVRSLQ